MNKIMSLILAFALLISANMPVLAQSNPKNIFANKIKLYEIWPDMFAQEISEHVSLSQRYIITKPSASQAELSALQQSLKESEINISKVLKSKLADDAFIYDLYHALARKDASPRAKTSFSLMYTKEAVNNLATGNTPRSAVNILKETPEFFNKAALEILDKSSADFSRLINQIQRSFSLSRSRAVSLALSVEVEYAQTLLGNKISGLRNKISNNKFLIRQAGTRADKQVDLLRKQITEAQKEIIELKRIYANPERSISFAVGEKELDNIINIVSKTNTPELIAATNAAGKKLNNEFLAKARSSVKNLKSVLPIAIGAGLFLTIFTAQANAANSAAAETEIINAVAGKANLKREILNSINQNPENIGIIYTGGPEVKAMISELFENEGDNSLSSQRLLPYIEEWNQRISTLANDEAAMKEYLNGIKEVNDAAIKEQLNSKIQHDLTIKQDKTAVKKYIPIDLMKFENNK